MARKMNPRPGTVVCVARGDGEILYENQGAFYARIAGRLSHGRQRGDNSSRNNHKAGRRQKRQK